MENLNKLTKLLGADRIMTADDVQQILLGIMEILKSYKEGTETINEETKQIVNSLLEHTVKYNQETISDFKSEAEKAHAERIKELQTFLSEVKTTLGDMEVMMSEVKDGEDADEERVIEEVINRIKIDPTVVTMSAEEVRDKLASLKNDARLDKSAIKGLEKILQQKDLDYAIATLQHQASFLINKGGLKNVTAGTNVTIDYTDPSNPIISSSGGGGGGSPGGSNTQLQYNNAGNFGGITGATTDGTTVTFTTGNLVANDVKASGSGGLHLHNNTGQDCFLSGAGGGINNTAYGSLKADYATASEILITDASKNIVSAPVATYPSLTELSYVKGVTSAIQTQLNAKQNTLSVSDTTEIDLTLSGATLSAAIVASSIDESKLDTSVNASLDLADTSVQPNSSPTLGTITTTGNIELGNASDTTLSRSSAGVLAVEGVVIPSISSTNTLTNKRVTKRVGTTTSSATPTINTDNVDYYSLTAQTVDITSFTTNLSGTPTDNQTLWISITGTAARAITWGTSFEASTVALPTTTVSTNRLDVGFVWNAATSKWRCVASA